MNYKNFIIKIIENDIINNNNLNIKTRFAPEPNGYLHIGHVKSIFINFYIAKKYNGIFNLRFDDTNPDNENIEYVNAIKKDILWLGFKWDEIKYTSDYFDKIFNFAIELINKNLAYIDDLNENEIKIYKGNYTTNGIESPYRNRTIDENIYLFNKMKEGFFKEKTKCLRLKLNIKSNIILLRDPIIYRIKFKKHFKTNYNWCIYPTYDFSHCISDSLEKITHSICTLEFINNKYLYDWILNNIKVNHFPKQYEFSKLNIENNILSKRKLSYIIKNKIIKKWDDPRLLTISGIKNRGYTSNSIIEFCKNIGITKKNSLIKIDVLENFLIKDIDKNSFRLMAIIDPIILVILNYKKNNIEYVKANNIPLNSKMGYRNILFSKYIYVEKNDFKKILNIKNNNIFIKLRYSYILKIIKINLIKNNIKNIFCIYIKNSINEIFYKGQKIKHIIHWVSCFKNIKSKFIIYDNKLFIENKINKNNYSIKYGYIEYFDIRNINFIYQFERIGFFLIKKRDIKKNMVLSTLVVKLKNNQFI